MFITPSRKIWPHFKQKVKVSPYFIDMRKDFMDKLQMQFGYYPKYQ